MADVSQTASNLRDISNTVTSALRTHRVRIAKKVIERIFGGSPPPDLTVEELVSALADYLDESTDSFAAAASKVLAEVSEDKSATSAVAVALDELRDEVISQRSLIDGTYGAGTAVQFGYAGTTPESANDLVEASRTIEGNLREQTFPKARPGRPALDRDELAELLADLRRRLEKVGKHNHTEERETQAARSDRNNHRDDWDLAYKGVANLAVGFFQIAREQELADRVRPTARRRLGQPEQEDRDDEPQNPVEDVEPVEA